MRQLPLDHWHSWVSFCLCHGGKFPNTESTLGQNVVGTEISEDLLSKETAGYFSRVCLYWHRIAFTFLSPQTSLLSCSSSFGLFLRLIHCLFFFFPSFYSIFTVKCPFLSTEQNKMMSPKILAGMS